MKFSCLYSVRVATMLAWLLMLAAVAVEATKVAHVQEPLHVYCVSESSMVQCRMETELSLPVKHCDGQNTLLEASFKIQLGIDNQDPTRNCNKQTMASVHSNSTNRVSFDLKTQIQKAKIVEFVEDRNIGRHICSYGNNRTLQCTSRFEKPMWLNFHMCLKKSSPDSVQLSWFQQERTLTSNAWLISNVLVSMWHGDEKCEVKSMFNFNEDSSQILFRAQQGAEVITSPCCKDDEKVLFFTGTEVVKREFVLSIRMLNPRLTKRNHNGESTDDEGGSRDDEGGSRDDEGGSRDSEGGSRGNEGGSRDDESGSLREDEGGSRDNEGESRNDEGGSRGDESGSRDNEGGSTGNGESRDNDGESRNDEGGSRGDESGSRDNEGGSTGNDESRDNDGESRNDEGGNRDDEGGTRDDEAGSRDDEGGSKDEGESRDNEGGSRDDEGGVREGGDEVLDGTPLDTTSLFEAIQCNGDTCECSNNIPNFGIQNAFNISISIVQANVANTSLSKAITYAECWIRTSLNNSAPLPTINQTELLTAVLNLLNELKRYPEFYEDSSGLSRVLDLFDVLALRVFDDGEYSIGGLELQVQTIDEVESSMVEINIEKNSITLPAEVFNITGSRKVASYHFQDTLQVFPKEFDDAQLSSPVISAALLCNESVCNTSVLELNKDRPVQIVLTHKEILDSKQQQICAFWETSRFRDSNPMNSSWSTRGCELNQEKSTPTEAVCECNHLTHFAILLSPVGVSEQISEDHVIALQIIGYIGVSISLLALAVTALVFILLKSLWSIRNYIHVHLCLSLMAAQLVFVIGVDKTSNKDVCSFIGVLLHYLFLVSFMWMLMEGVVLYVVLVKVFLSRSTKRLYICLFTLLSYGLPLLYMALVIPLGFLLNGTTHYVQESKQQNGTITACWLSYDTYFIWSFILPVILIILINSGFFVMAVVILKKQRSKTKVDQSKLSSIKEWLKSAISLVVVMGLTWIVGVLIFHRSLLPLAYIFTIVVAFQGLAIFIILIPMSKQVRLVFMRCLRDRVNKSSFLSSHFGDKLESWISASRDSSNGSTNHKAHSAAGGAIELGSFSTSNNISTTTQDNVFTNPSYEEPEWGTGSTVTYNTYEHIIPENLYETIKPVPTRQLTTDLDEPTEYCMPVKKQD